MRVARELARAWYRAADRAADGTPTLRHWRGGWWRWQQSHRVEDEQRAARAAAYRFTEFAAYEQETPHGTVVHAWAPNGTRSRTCSWRSPRSSICLRRVSQPRWIDGDHDRTVVASANGLLDVASRTLDEHTPRFFNQTAVPFDFDPAAPLPWAWFEFLSDLWGDDDDSINALQEFFGYVISGRLDLHKILLLVGPTRAGKGVIARTLTALVGADNVAGPTLSSLAGDFGLAPLLGKPLAITRRARAPRATAPESANCR
jgi:putative DNA primase/helicase